MVQRTAIMAMLLYGLFVLLYNITFTIDILNSVAGTQRATPDLHVSAHTFQYLEPSQNGDEQLHRQRYQYSRSELLNLRTIGESTSAVSNEVWKTLKSFKLTKVKFKRGSRAGRNKRRKIQVITHGGHGQSNANSTQTWRRGSVVSNLISVPIGTSSKDYTNYAFSTPPVFLINARSLVQRIDELQIMLDTSNIDIAAITETWFPAHIDTSVFSIPNFDLISKPRINKRGGGVALYVRNDIEFRTLSEIKVHDDLEVLWIWTRPRRLPRSVSGIIICVVYHPPSSPHDNILTDHLLSSLNTLETNYPNVGVILLRNFNKLETENICRLSGLLQVVKTPTRGQANLDKILTKLERSVSRAAQIITDWIERP